MSYDRTMTEIQEELFKRQDLKYRDFQSKLIPNINKETVIGVRTPILRKYAKTLKEKEIKQFLKTVPHFYYEENVLHMILIGQIKEYRQCIDTLNVFLSYIDNWAVCDLPLPKCFKKHKIELLMEIQTWLKEDSIYTKRFAIGCLMRLHLDEDFKLDYLDWVSSIQSDAYYLNMMIAWYFATALAKQWESTLPYIEKNVLSDWVHKKTIQKARESYRLTSEKKEYLKSLL